VRCFLTATDPTTATRLPFRYEAQTSSGQPIRGTLEAASAMEVQQQLASLGLRVLSVDPAPGATKSRLRPVGAEDFLLFNQQLAHMTAAGLPVERGLRLIAADLNSGRLSSAINAIADELEKGTPLHDAFAHHASRFPPLYANLIQAGVEANNLPALLFNFGRHLEFTANLRKTLWRTLAYPIAVLLALAAVMLFVSADVLPHLRGVYEQLGNPYWGDYEMDPAHRFARLPLITQWLLWLGPKIPWIIGILAATVLALVGIYLLLRSRGKEGVFIDTLLLRIPLIGVILKRSMTARWCDSLRIAVEAGVDLPTAVSLAARSVGSPRLMRESQELVRGIAGGAPAATLPGMLIPPAIPAAIEFASKTGDLPATLATLTRMYEQQAEQRLRALPAILTPLLLLLIGVVIGLTIAAMFAPLLKLLALFSGAYGGP
jgi:type IV pilus assembly protein PilC